MRILIVSNLYPPVYIGGYELGCYDVAKELEARGHQLHVLTSDYSKAIVKQEENVYRILKFNQPFIDRRSTIKTLRGIFRELKHMKTIERLLMNINPEIILIFNLGGISDSTLKLMQKFGKPLLYYLSDIWILRNYIYGDPMSNFLGSASHNYLVEKLKYVLRSYISRVIPNEYSQLESSQLCFSSVNLKMQHYNAPKLAAVEAQVIYWGIDNSFVHKRDWNNIATLRILYAGRLILDKGVHTILEMVKILAERSEFTVSKICVNIIGDGEANYVSKLHEFVETYQFNAYVHFSPRVPHEDMPCVYANHDVLIFPSIWEEPFSIALLEAMASGLAIVGTIQGGSKEILMEGYNALVFSAGDSQRLAEKIMYLLEHDNERIRLARNAQQTVTTHYTKSVMVDSIENKLENLLKNTLE